MRQLISILLLFLLTWQTVFQYGFICYWKINQKYIAQTQCENKDKPQMHCDGKCYLAKQLKKTEEKEASKDNLPSSIMKLKTFDSFIIHRNCLSTEIGLSLLFKKLSENNSCKLLTGFQNPPFHPPEIYLT